MPTTLLHAPRIFRPSYGPAECLKTTQFLRLDTIVTILCPSMKFKLDTGL